MLQGGGTLQHGDEIAFRQEPDRLHPPDGGFLAMTTKGLKVLAMTETRWMVLR
jgi:hypothetical protein